MNRRGSRYRPGRSLVTGASSGIGAEFARVLAARGSDLVLVARREDRLTTLADELERTHGIHCRTVAWDLSEEASGRRLREVVPERIDLVVNNAGFAVQGPFVDGDADDFALRPGRWRCASTRLHSHRYAGSIPHDGRMGRTSLVGRFLG